VTNADIFIQILSEASGKPREEVETLADTFYQTIGSRFRLDEELSDDKAQELLKSMRQELPGIRAWLVQGGLMANPGGVKGTA
jgi:hypothetical protein